MNERYELTIERIQSILSEKTVDIVYRDYFQTVAEFILEIHAVKEQLEQGAEHTLEELQNMNRKLYGDICGGNYEESYANPVYAVAELGEEIGRLLCFLYTEIRSEIPHVYEGKTEYLTICNELFIEIYNCFEAAPMPDYRELRNIIYWYASDYCDVYVTDRIRQQVVPEACGFAKDIITKSDLSDLRYLYQYGEFVSENVVKAASMLNVLTEEELDAQVGELEPFDKSTVEIRYQIGNERIVKKIMEKLAAAGHEVVIYRAAVNAVTKDGLEKQGFYGGVPNPQYEFDHQEDQGLFLNKKFVERKRDVMKNAYEENKKYAKQYAGAITIEPFEQEGQGICRKLEAISFTERQEALLAFWENKSEELVTDYKYL